MSREMHKLNLHRLMFPYKIKNSSLGIYRIFYSNRREEHFSPSRRSYENLNTLSDIIQTLYNYYETFLFINIPYIYIYIYIYIYMTIELLYVYRFSFNKDDGML